MIYNTGILPAEWKSANIVPIHKKEDKDLISNYRPISLTCLTSKIMEHMEELLIKTKIMEHIMEELLVKTKIMEHILEELLIKTRHLINPEQHGFLLGKSCTTNLITITDDIATSLHNDKCVDIVYFDFAKEKQPYITLKSNPSKVQKRLLGLYTYKTQLTADFGQIWVTEN